MQTGTQCAVYTQRGQIMPGTLMGYVTDQQTGEVVAADVKAPGGKTYTCALGNILTEQEARIARIQTRGEKLARDGYRVRVWQDERDIILCRVWHPKRHNYPRGAHLVAILQDGVVRCTCPTDALTCKHRVGLPGLLRREIRRLRATGEAQEADWIEREALASLLWKAGLEAPRGRAG